LELIFLPSFLELYVQGFTKIPALGYALRMADAALPNPCGG